MIPIDQGGGGIRPKNAFPKMVAAAWTKELQPKSRFLTGLSDRFGMTSVRVIFGWFFC